jgi:FkbM family methyltransferase
MKNRLRRLWLAVKWPIPLWRLRGYANLPVGTERFRFYGLRPVNYVWALEARRGRYEPEVTALLESELRPGDVFLDVGAHMGAFSLLAAKKGAAAHAVEPDPASDRLLHLNAHRNQLPIQTEASALSDHEGEVLLATDNGGGASRLDNHGVRVSCRPLDALGLQPDIVKIDVEGAEAKVLRGGMGTLRKARLVVVEVHHRKIANDHGDDPGWVMAALESLGPVEVVEERDPGRNANYAVRPSPEC